MENLSIIPEILSSIPLRGILRIDMGLEGDWSSTVVPIWSNDSGFIGFSNVIESHPLHKPSLEIYFQGLWLGIHCFKRENGNNVFDKNFARKVIEFVETKIR